MLVGVLGDHPVVSRQAAVGMRGERRRVNYRRVHQASMITSWAMPVSMV
jgi:hypothetical protein